MARISAEAAGGLPVLAMLDAIAWAEIGPEMLADPATDDGYAVLVGSRPSHLLLFHDYSHHPQVLNHALNSTAAGRYQVIRGTWFGVSGELHLKDFSPVNQDMCAVQLIFERGALPYVLSGDIEHAISMCSAEWASLPGAGATLPDGTPQHEQRMQDLVSVFRTALARYEGSAV